MAKREKPNRILYVIGRDDWIKNEYMSRMSVSGMRDLGLKIIWEDPSCGWLFRIRQMGRIFPGMPHRARSFDRKLIRLCYGIFHWGYFSFRKRLNKGLEFRVENLRKELARIGDGSEIFILSYSSGSRVCSLIADSFKIKGLICIGYPFRHPVEGDNPERYHHLADLKTPMLLVQGNRDEYGGSEVVSTLPLSPCIEIFIVDSTHDYLLDRRQWSEVMAKIESTLRP